jgi:hypothetical protein
MNEFELRVLRLFDEYEIHNSLYWRVDGGSVSWFVLCNDLFYWGLSEQQAITPDTIDVLERSIKDCEAISQSTSQYGVDLYSCRVRGMRPQGAAYPHGMDGDALDPLFDACGPEREIFMMNPCTADSYRRQIDKQANKGGGDIAEQN